MKRFLFHVSKHPDKYTEFGGKRTENFASFPSAWKKGFRCFCNMFCAYLRISYYFEFFKAFGGSKLLFVGLHLRYYLKGFVVLLFKKKCKNLLLSNQLSSLP